MAFFRSRSFWHWRKAFWAASIVSWLIGGPTLSQENPDPSPTPLTAPMPGFVSRTDVPPPDFLAAPHPTRAEIGDLRRLLAQADPESRTLAEECAVELEAKPTRQEAENKIRANPLKYHWCFYRMVLGLEDTLRATDDYLARKRTTISTYARLLVLAQAFDSVFHDKRYLEFAAEHYRRLNEYVFSRKLVATQENAAETHTARKVNPFPFFREPPDPSRSVLGRYGIRPEPFLKGLAHNHEDSASRAPASK